MTIFVDTSAMIAVLHIDDTNHALASDVLRRYVDAPLVTHNYVVLEAAALIQRRFGLAAVRLLLERLVPALEVVWIDEERHDRAMGSLLARRRRSVSLVDWASFDLMRERGIQDAFAYDDDFRREGFTLLA
ncbi:MAG TPA: PIN domain-containing protein [Candidatus Limnocylindria bacterium]|nr:PIN domain-containing protein [Candidatus Limnocylindria bacterium]